MTELNFSLPRLAIISALRHSENDTIKAESNTALERVLQGLVPPAHSNFWTLGENRSTERPTVFMHTLRRMGESKLVDLIWSTNNRHGHRQQRPILIVANLTQTGEDYALHWHYARKGYQFTDINEKINEILLRIDELEIRADVADRQWSAAFNKWETLDKRFNNLRGVTA